METTFIDYEVGEGIATITLNRPEAANAQTLELLDDLDEAWRRAADDDDVRVIILQANGKHFSAGHDIKGVSTDDGTPPTWTLAGIYQTEARRFLEYSLRWRNVPKPSIAAVQGVCIAGGLLLAWPCDLIIAADNAKFSDPVVNMGIGGVEYHGHTWEFGAAQGQGDALHRPGDDGRGGRADRHGHPGRAPRRPPHRDPGARRSRSRRSTRSRSARRSGP